MNLLIRKRPAPYVGIIGEEHGNTASDEVLDYVLAKTGIKEVALEMPRNLQPAADIYTGSKHTKRDKSRFQNKFIDAEMPPNYTITQYPKQIAPDIGGMIRHMDTAREHGAHVTLADSPSDSPVMKRTYRARGVEGGKLNMGVVAGETIIRNGDMEGVIGKFQEPVIAVVGAAHTGHSAILPSLDDKLNKHHIPTVSVDTSEKPCTIRKKLFGKDADHATQKPDEAAHFISDGLARAANAAVYEGLAGRTSNNTMVTRREVPQLSK